MLIVIPNLLISQTWEKTYEFGAGLSVIQTIEGDFAVTGYLGQTGPNPEFNEFLMKTDETGVVQWSRTYDRNSFGIGYSIQQTSDGGYIIAGIDEGYDILLIKANNIGDTIWTKIYTGASCKSVQETNDGGYIVCGATQIDQDTFLYLLKTDNNGDTTWTKKYSGGGIGYSIGKTNDDGFVITGKIPVPNSGQDLYLLKTDSTGDTLWTKTYGGKGPDLGQSVQQTIDNGFIITGYTTIEGIRNLYLLKTDLNGDTLWTKSYSTGFEDIGLSVQQTSDDGFIITGFSYRPNTGEDVILIKTDNIGDIIWTKTYGGQSHDDGASVQQTSDGGYIIAGRNNIGLDNYIYLIKTNDEGNIVFTAEIPVSSLNKKLVKRVDLFGKEISVPKPNTPFIEIYGDGTTQKKMKLK